MRDRGRILIVGGGIAGLTVATALSRRGIEADLVERRDDWPTEGAAITLHANGVRVLRGLGLGGLVDEASTALPSWVFCDAEGRALCETDLRALWGEVGPCVGITRERLQRALLSGIGATRTRLGVAVVALAPHDERVSVGLSDGRSEDYGLVIG